MSAAASLVAVLYVQPGGEYYKRSHLDLWPESHDARRYSGPYPVVAHPPCARWCQLAHMNQAIHGYRIGDDGGCFEIALAAVRRYGGVLEHPERTLAWAAHGLQRPKRGGGWLQTARNEWVCEVSQAAYGHRARKLTWLLYCGEQPPPELDWSLPAPTAKIGGEHSDRPRSKLVPLNRREASATPPRFADLLIELAQHSRRSKPQRSQSCSAASAS